MKSMKPIIVAVAVIALVFVVMIFDGKKIPSVAVVSVAMAEQTDLCTTHQLPIAECYVCDPALREPGRLWCNEHERYEDRCFICHPELKEAGRLWCDEHNLYEDECFFCHPELRASQDKSNGKEAATDKEAKVQQSSSSALQCLEHGVLEEECGICHPDLLDTLLSGQGLKIRLESTESALKAGVETSTPTTKSSLAGLVVLSRVSYDLNHLARITPLTAGVVQKVFANAGDNVAKGQVLVEIVSPEVARSKSNYLSALDNEALKEIVFKREKGLVEKRFLHNRSTSRR